MSYRVKISFILSIVPPYPPGNWFQGPPRIPKYTDAQVPYIKWLSTVGPPGPRVQNLQFSQPRIVNRLHGWLNPRMRNPRIPRANHKLHSIERCYQWEKELISYFACAFYLWLQRQCSLVMFLISSCLPLTQNQSWRKSSRFIENASPSHLTLSRVPSWFWILYWKQGELLQTRMIYNWMTAVWKQILPESYKNGTIRAGCQEMINTWNWPPFLFVFVLE